MTSHRVTASSRNLAQMMLVRKSLNSMQAAHSPAAGMAAGAEPGGGGRAGARGVPGLAPRAGRGGGHGAASADAL